MLFVLLVAVPSYQTREVTLVSFCCLLCSSLSSVYRTPQGCFTLIFALLFGSDLVLIEFLLEFYIYCTTFSFRRGLVGAQVEPCGWSEP